MFMVMLLSLKKLKKWDVNRDFIGYHSYMRNEIVILKRIVYEYLGEDMDIDMDS